MGGRLYAFGLSVVCISCASRSAPSVTEEQLAEIDRIFAQADTGDDAADRAFHEQLQRLSALRPGGDPCRVPFDEGDAGRFADRLAGWVASTRDGKSPGGMQADHVTIVDGPVDRLSSASVQARRDEEARLRHREEAYAALGGLELVARARALAATPLQAELLIVIDRQERPRAVDDQTFAAGSIAARAYLFHEGRFVCAGDVLASSSKTVEVWYQRGGNRDDEGYLSGDLYVNLLDAAKRNLHAL